LKQRIAIFVNFEKKHAFTQINTDMTQVIALYELYEHLPKKAKKEFKKLIESEEEQLSLSDEIRDGLREIKDIKEGKIKANDLTTFIKELENER
jgi:hypothetical protein